MPGLGPGSRDFEIPHLDHFLSECNVNLANVPPWMRVYVGSSPISLTIFGVLDIYGGWPDCSPGPFTAAWFDSEILHQNYHIEFL